MIRRAIDILVAAVVLIVALPLFAAIAVLVVLTDGVPILFRQKRAGLNGVPFTMLKFRTMRVDAERSGGTLTFKSDPRITPIGGILRRYKLDELPQLWNILRGDMTIIGPRPEVLDWIARYTPEQREVLSVKPGLTDPVQLFFRHEQEYLSSAAEYAHLFEIKVARQIAYIRARTFFSDLLTAWQTALALVPQDPSREELAVYSEIATKARRRDKGGTPETSEQQNL